MSAKQKAFFLLLLRDCKTKAARGCKVKNTTAWFSVVNADFQSPAQRRPTFLALHRSSLSSSGNGWTFTVRFIYWLSLYLQLLFCSKNIRELRGTYRRHSICPFSLDVLGSGWGSRRQEHILSPPGWPQGRHRPGRLFKPCGTFWFYRSGSSQLDDLRHPDHIPKQP